MSQQQLVSVLIPVYNAGEYLNDAVLSIVNQTHENIEIIIVDDGSTDGCIDSIRDLTDSRIRLLSQKNGGKSVALNHALEKVAGDFFLIQDADDNSYPQRIEVMLDCLLNNETLAAVFSGHDLLLGKKRFAPTFKSIDERGCQQLIDQLSMPAHDPTGMYRLSALSGMRFDDTLWIGQGVDFVLRVGEKCPMVRLGDCLYSYRINYSSTIRRDANKTNASVNVVREKACVRRSLDFDQFKVDFKPRAVKGRYLDADIIPHCMESVIDLKRQGCFFDACIVGWQCAKLHPLGPYFYKPFVYVVTPVRIINLFRRIKACWF